TPPTTPTHPLSLHDALPISSAVLVILCANPPARAASVQPLEIVTKSGVQVFSVEMATTEEEKTTGLMYRKELPDGKGMLFDFSRSEEHTSELQSRSDLVCRL